MALTDEQSQQIKKHLLKQLSNFSQDKREQIAQQVNTMTPNQIEDFVRQNQLTHLRGPCIFCSIISGRTSSLQIAKNKNNIAILEINPLSKGHTLIVPREHSAKIESSAQELAKEVREKLKKKFSPKTIESKEINTMGHSLIEIIPIYKDNGTPHERKQITYGELKTIQEEILKDTTKLPQNSNIQEYTELPTKLKDNEAERFALSKTNSNTNREQEKNLGSLDKEPKPKDTTLETKKELFKMPSRIPR